MLFLAEQLRSESFVILQRICRTILIVGRFLCSKGGKERLLHPASYRAKKTLL